MNGLLSDPRFMIGMGLLGSNQPSLTPQNPMQNIMQNMMAGQQMKQQLSAQQMAQQKFELDKKYKEAQMQQMQAPKAREMYEAVDGKKYWKDDPLTRVNPNAKAKPEKESEIISIAKRLYPNNAAAQNAWINKVKLKPSSTVNVNNPTGNPLLEIVEEDHIQKYVDDKGNPPPYAMSRKELRDKGYTMINTRDADIQKEFDKAYAEKDLMLTNTEGTLQKYRDTLDSLGTQILPSAKKLKLQGAYTDLEMSLKNLHELGVLAGADLDLIEAMAENPTGFVAAYVERRGDKALDGQLQLIQDKIDRERGNARRFYRQKDGGGSLTQDELKELEELRAAKERGELEI